MFNTLNYNKTTNFNNNMNINIKDENMFYNTQILKIRKYLEKDTNLDKVINFYKKNTGLLDKFYYFINSNNLNNSINLPYDVFQKYYDDLDNISFIKRIDYSIEPNIKKENNNTLIKVDLLELYLSRQEELGIEIFNINDNRKYFPLQKNSLCFMTNFAKLNVIQWLIEIGFYNL